MRKQILLLIIVVYTLSACMSDTSRLSTSYFSMDSLVNAQIAYFANEEVLLNKSATINGIEESNVLTPDSLVWASELEIFRKADITKAAYSNAFDISIIPDTESNLKILQYTSKSELPVKSLKIYFLHEVSDVRKISAVIKEDTRVFTNDKVVNMNFEKVSGISVLKNYNIEGKQKMLLSDSTLYSIRGSIDPK
jgi:hypothetical protein